MVSFSHRPAPKTLTAILRRILDGLATAWAAVTLTFFALRIAAGDPLASLLSQGLATPEHVERMRRMLGLDRPLLVQYLDFLLSLLRGEMGASIYTGRPVRAVILEQVPATAELAAFALLVAICLGLLLGTLAAWRKGRPGGIMAENIAGLATGLPVAFTGILAILLFTALIRAAPDARDFYSLKRLVLPALVLGFSSSGPIARVVQSGLETSLRAPYMLAARARGISGGFRLLWHALRPSLPPVISLGALEAAFLFAGTVVTETVFSRAGLGRLLVSSILQGDFPVAQGIVVLAAVLYTLSQSLADIFAGLIDPRLEGAL